MIDKVPGNFGVHQIAMILGVASQVVRAFEQEFKEDGISKNLAIDSIVDVLLKHKDSEPKKPESAQA